MMRAYIINKNKLFKKNYNGKAWEYTWEGGGGMKS